MKLGLCVPVLALLCECGYGGWSFWSDWSTCPTPCEGRSKSRRRYCVTQFCNGYYYQVESCEPRDCLVTKQNHETTALTFKVTKQQTVSHKSPSTILLASTRLTSAAPQGLWNRFNAVTISSSLRNTENLNTENLSQIPNTLTTYLSVLGGTNVREEFIHKQSRKETYELTSSKETTNDNVNNTVVLVVLPVFTMCMVLYTTAKLYQMFRVSRSENLPSVGLSSPSKILSLSENTTQSQEVREYHYVSYDEISKRGSYEDKSPSQSYVYDVTWL